MKASFNVFEILQKVSQKSLIPIDIRNLVAARSYTEEWDRFLVNWAYPEYEIEHEGYAFVHIKQEIKKKGFFKKDKTVSVVLSADLYFYENRDGDLIPLLAEGNVNNVKWSAPTVREQLEEIAKKFGYFPKVYWIKIRDNELTIVEYTIVS